MKLFLDLNKGINPPKRTVGVPGAVSGGGKQTSDCPLGPMCPDGGKHEIGSVRLQEHTELSQAKLKVGTNPLDETSGKKTGKQGVKPGSQNVGSTGSSEKTLQKPTKQMVNLDHIRIADHAGQSSKLKESVQSHLDGNANLSEGERVKGQRIIEALNRHEKLKRTPDEGHSAELKELHTLAGDMQKPHEAEKAGSSEEGNAASGSTQGAASSPNTATDESPYEQESQPQYGLQGAASGHSLLQDKNKQQVAKAVNIPNTATDSKPERQSTRGYKESFAEVSSGVTGGDPNDSAQGRDKDEGTVADELDEEHKRDSEIAKEKGLSPAVAKSVEIIEEFTKSISAQMDPLMPNVRELEYLMYVSQRNTDDKGKPCGFSRDTVIKSDAPIYGSERTKFNDWLLTNFKNSVDRLKK